MVEAWRGRSSSSRSGSPVVNTNASSPARAHDVADDERLARIVGRACGLGAQRSLGQVDAAIAKPELARADPPRLDRCVVGLPERARDLGRLGCEDDHARTRIGGDRARCDRIEGMAERCELAAHVVDRRRSLRRIARDHAREQAVERRVAGRSLRDRPLAVQQLVEQHAEPVDVAPHVDAAARELGCAMRRCEVAGRRRQVEVTRELAVEQCDARRSADHDGHRRHRLRVDVEVEDPFAVERREAVADLRERERRDLGRLRPRRRQQRGVIEQQRGMPVGGEVQRLRREQARMPDPHERGRHDARSQMILGGALVVDAQVSAVRRVQRAEHAGRDGTAMLQH